MLYSRYSLVICSIHGSVSMLIPITSSSRPNPFPLGCCCYSVTQSCPPLCQSMDCSMPGLPVLHHLMELAQTYVHWVSDAIQTFHCLLTPLLMPSIFPSIRDFSNDLALCIRWLKYWSFNFSISPSNEYSESFRIDWFDLVTVQGTFKSLLQHHSSKPSILGCSSLLYGPTLTSIPYYWKNNKFGSMELVSKVMLLLFKMLFRLVIAFLPKSKFLNFMAAVTICSDTGAQQNKVCHCFCCFPSTCHWLLGPDAMIFFFWILSFKSAFSLSLSPPTRGSLVPLFFLPLGWCHLHVWGYWYFSQQSLFQLMLHPSRHFTWCTLYII